MNSPNSKPVTGLFADRIFLSEDIRKPFCRGKAMLTGDFTFRKNTTVWVFLLASNFKHFTGQLLTDTVFGQGPVYVGTKCMYHKQFVCFWACVYVCVSLYMLQTPRVLNTSFCTLFADSSGLEDRQLAGRASVCINDLLSGHSTPSQPPPGLAQPGTPWNSILLSYE